MNLIFLLGVAIFGSGRCLVQASHYGYYGNFHSMMRPYSMDYMYQPYHYPSHRSLYYGTSPYRRYHHGEYPFRRNHYGMHPYRRYYPTMHSHFHYPYNRRHYYRRYHPYPHYRRYGPHYRRHFNYRPHHLRYNIPWNRKDRRLMRIDHGINLFLNYKRLHPRNYYEHRAGYRALSPLLLASNRMHLPSYHWLGRRSGYRYDMWRRRDWRLRRNLRHLRRRISMRGRYWRMRMRMMLMEEEMRQRMQHYSPSQPNQMQPSYDYSHQYPLTGLSHPQLLQQSMMNNYSFNPQAPSMYHHFLQMMMPEHYY